LPEADYPELKALHAKISQQALEEVLWQSLHGYTLGSALSFLPRNPTGLSCPVHYYLHRGYLKTDFFSDDYLTGAYGPESGPSSVRIQSYI